MQLNNFHYAITLAEILHEITGDTEDLEEIALVAYNFIGNKNTFLQSVLVDVDCKTGIAKLPCGADIIEAVTYCGPEDWNYTSNKEEYGDLSSAYTENYIESLKVFTDPLYISGKFVKYQRVGNTLHINKGMSRIRILYHGILLDEEGLPMINDKEAVAIADYIAYILKYKEAMRTNNSNLFLMALAIKKQWLIHCNAARVPEYISQEEMDLILNIQASWNRKVYNKSFKAIN